MHIRVSQHFLIYCFLILCDYFVKIIEFFFPKFDKELFSFSENGFVLNNIDFFKI